MRDKQDAVYLQGVLERWRAVFAEAEGDHIKRLCDAGAMRGTEDDWTQLRPLLRVIRTMLIITSTFADQIGSGLERSIESTADAQTAQDMHAFAFQLREAMRSLRSVLDATDPDPTQPDGPGAGRPRHPVHVIDPAAGGLRGLVDIPAVAGTGLLIGVGTALGATYQASRVWWRATRSPDQTRRPLWVRRAWRPAQSTRTISAVDFET